jgi:hypothetical protein
METDRELLELAAKAAGIQIHHWSTILPGPMMVNPETDDCGGYWNPLDEDGDALRLAVKLNMSIDVDSHETSTYAYAGPAVRVYAWELWGKDKDSATRRAIVRAAAEIAKANP